MNAINTIDRSSLNDRDTSVGGSKMNFIMADSQKDGRYHLSS